MRSPGMLKLSLLIEIVLIVVTVQGAIDQGSSKLKNQNLVLNADVSHFNCKDKPRISRFADVRDCTRFIYCVSGTPHVAKCWPEGARFNSKTTRCDLPATEPCGNTVGSNAPLPFRPTPGPSGGLKPNKKPIVAQNPTTATPSPTTTTTTSKSPPLSDAFSFTLDCGGAHQCGLYPNHEGDCSTFFLCSERGRRTKKSCHDGQQFDTVSQECRPAKEATCWQEPDSGPYIRTRMPAVELCQRHNFNTSLLQNDTILSTPPLTNWGDWQNWESCPSGSYISGINAWRRLIQVGSRADHAGLISIGAQCRSLSGVVTKVLESIAPAAPNDGFHSFYSCVEGAAAIGFRANIQKDQGPGRDNVATDNVELVCSCGPPAFKPYDSIPGPQSGHRGDWTAVQSCRPREALCGLQTQMATYKEGVVGQYDNTGLNNVRMRCCAVPDPVTTCTPTDRIVPVRSCPKNEGIYPRRCDFQYTIGTGYAYDNQAFVNSVNFHQSIGHVLNDDVMSQIKERFQKEANQLGGN
ncbi:Peritrophin-1 [Folsomia candida]|uniref:Peritrophin-1 n=1 Tax=Folsomia candida TaxID=158441 RepID=A0A226E3Z5_FOLCA|nr:Peritrophin-1 [Folsomia candida]